LCDVVRFLHDRRGAMFRDQTKVIVNFVRVPHDGDREAGVTAPLCERDGAIDQHFRIDRVDWDGNGDAHGLNVRAASKGVRKSVERNREVSSPAQR